MRFDLLKEIILIKSGEIALKGQNRRSFEDKLISNIRRRLSPLGEFEYRLAQSTLSVEPKDELIDLDEAADRVSRVFGISGFSRACVAEKDIDDIKNKAAVYLESTLSAIKTFKVETKRSDKQFPLKSPQISEEVGGFLLERFKNLSVDVHNPDFIVYVEVRDYAAYIRGPQEKGAGGMPVGTGGRAGLLISGGIDSPVAAYMMAKRGVELTAVHFASPPYTSERAEIKVKDLLAQVARYAGVFRLYTVCFTEIQEQIGEHCKEEFFTIIMRRMMMRIAERIAKKEHCKALVTGESIGQVASQTMDALCCTDAVCSVPVFRPLIAMDKDEIVSVSRRIGTFDISVRPYEDCCTVFTPRHPRTRPKMEDVIFEESKLDIEGLIEKATADIRYETIYAE